MIQLKRYFIETWGCQMNAHDSEKLAGSLRRMGLSPTASESDADVVILNTCSVREKAQEKVFARLRNLTAQKKHRSVVVGVAGCVAQQEGEAIFERSPDVDFVLGTQSLVQLPEVIATVVGKGEQVVELGRHPENLDIPPEQIERVTGVKAYVTIMEGCDNFCTFCIVPFTRGRERCRPIDHIMLELQALARAGFLEVQLLGQNVNSYQDPTSGASFEELLDAANDVDGIRRLRFTSPHPKDFGRALIERFRDLDKLCPHMHLPAQSGSTAVLERMNRGYTRDEFLEKVELARELVPDLALSTDLIVGFPGETDGDFDDTFTLIQHVAFDSIYSFKYSERPYTYAAREQPDDVPESVKADRLARLQTAQKQIQSRKNAAFVGRTVEVLVEGRSKKVAEELSGRTPENRVVNFVGRSEPGNIIPVRITRSGPNSLFGEYYH